MIYTDCGIRAVSSVHHVMRFFAAKPPGSVATMSLLRSSGQYSVSPSTLCQSVGCLLRFLFHPRPCQFVGFFGFGSTVDFVVLVLLRLCLPSSPFFPVSSVSTASSASTISLSTRCLQLSPRAPLNNMDVSLEVWSSRSCCWPFICRGFLTHTAR